MTRDELWAAAVPYYKEKRIPHVLGCEAEALKLAELWGADAVKVSFATLLHDVTKKCSYEEHKELIRKYGLSADEDELANEKILHAKTGAALAQHIFGMDDEIAGAIRWHTTGKPDMSVLEKIIYLADCIEPTRDYPGVGILRDLAEKNIDRCMALALEMSISNIRSRGIEPYKDTMEAYEYYADT